VATSTDTPIDSSDGATDTSEAIPTARAAQELLSQLAGPDAVLRDDQAVAIDALVTDRSRTLLVQRTGWGKSAVYWIATRLRRDAGGGPTLVVSPLLALMRDQVAAARTLGLRAETLNSTNLDDWDRIHGDLAAGDLDVLLVSPERIDAPSFRERMRALAPELGLLVVDEAHCISDWGHDFRPDYRRVRELLDRLAPDTPVLACTATANERVTADVAQQLGTDVVTLRGRLGRSSLQLAVVHLADAHTRLAWLDAYVRQQRARNGRAGVIYALTVADTERVATFLRGRGLDVAAYSSAIEPEERHRLEDELQANDLDAVVATSSLGMGYDKRDLAFVVHLGAPSSPVAYYQQVGRAGRAIATAEVVLLPTAKDRAIWHHFDLAGIPTPEETDALLAALDTGRATSLPQLEKRVNVRRTRLELLLKVLAVDGAAEKVKGGWLATGEPWTHDAARYDALAELRRAEHAAMQQLVTPGFSGCLMRFLTDQLDDPAAVDCGRCSGCTGWSPEVDVDDAVVTDARRFLRGRDVLVRPRRRWPTGLPQVKGNLAEGRRAEVGRALAAGDESGWGDTVQRLREAAAAGHETELAPLVDEVVDGLTAVLARWDWAARPAAIVPVPSRTAPGLLEALTTRLGQLGRLPVVPAVIRTNDTPSQSAMANSAHKAGNALGAYTIDVNAASRLPEGPVLLVDLASDSGWTLTTVTWQLREHHPGPVLPLVLTTRP
jgi:ATP-dependent DNA helicase RecQ